MNTAKILEVVECCRQSPQFFLRNFGKVKHPAAGIIPFNLFSYQDRHLSLFLQKPRVIYKKTRQCVSGDSLVWAPEGPRKISAVKPGDLVNSVDPAGHDGRGTLLSVPISDVFDNGEADCVEVTTRGLYGQGVDRVVVTPDHQMAVQGKGRLSWVEASELQPGQQILQGPQRFNTALPLCVRCGCGSRGFVTAVRPAGRQRVFDLSVPPHRNYLANGFVVHNCGISTLAGGYVLWFLMFFKHKTVLVTSKRDQDAKEFLARNVQFVYDQLPGWFKELFPLKKANDHEMEFARTLSRVLSLTSGKDTLRSNSSSLNIIDEAGYTPMMAEMWSGGASTLMHGGRYIIISTASNVGGWYWNSWMDAKAGLNAMFPVEVEWQDMDWAIEFVDSVSGQKVRIAPRDGIRPSTPKELPTFSKWWSPWLESQYRELQSRGEAHKFAREILGVFEGAGSSVVPGAKLQDVEKQVQQAPDRQTASLVEYVHPLTDEKRQLNFQDDLWIWRMPVLTIPDQIGINGKILQKGEPGHAYVMGADSSTGEAEDYAAIEIFDATTLEQVAEWTGKADATAFAWMCDYLGRWYNSAKLIVERNGYGMAVLQALRDQLHYPNLWRGSKAGQLMEFGWKTLPNTKPEMNTRLINWCGEHPLYSPRLHKQLTTYVTLRAGKYGHEPGAGNHDDLVMAAALALVGIETSAFDPVPVFRPSQIPALRAREEVNFGSAAAAGLLMPMVFGGDMPDELGAVDRFTRQMLSTYPKAVPAVVQKKYPDMQR